MTESPTWNLGLDVLGNLPPLFLSRSRLSAMLSSVMRRLTKFLDTVLALSRLFLRVIAVVAAPVDDDLAPIVTKGTGLPAGAPLRRVDCLLESFSTSETAFSSECPELSPSSSASSGAVSYSASTSSFVGVSSFFDDTLPFFERALAFFDE